MDRLIQKSISAILCSFLAFLSCFIYHLKKGISSSTTEHQQLNIYERLLFETIANLTSKDFDKAKENFERLKSEIDLSSPIDKTFPSLSTLFQYPLTKVIHIIERELNFPHVSIGNTDVVLITPWWFSSSNEFLRSNFNAFEVSAKNFSDFSFLPDFYLVFPFTPSNKKRIILNLSDPDQIIINDNFSFVVNLLPPKGTPKKKQIYLLPNVRYILQALLMFIRDNFGCNPSVLYPEEKENLSSDLGELAWALGITFPVIIKYKGIDITPYLRTKSYEISPQEIKRKYKPSDIQKLNIPEIYSAIVDVFQKSACILLLDNPKNSSAIIPQIRFIGAKDVVFFGINWGRIKDYLEKRFYGRVYYADIVPENVDTTDFFISELKKLSEFLLSVNPREFDGFEKIEIKIDPQTIIVTPNGLILRSVFIWKVGETVEKVSEIIQDEIL